jgi:hypothetical protein
MRGLVDLIASSGPLLDLDAVNTTTMRDVTLFTEWLASGPRSRLTTEAKRSSRAYSDVVLPAFEAAFAAEMGSEADERSSLEAMIDAMPPRLPIIVDSRVPIGGARSILTRLDSPLNPLGSSIITSLEQVPDELFDRVAFVPMSPFTEYYVPQRSDTGELILHDPFSDREVRRGSRSAIRSLMRSVDRAELFASGLDEVIFPGYLLDASSAGAWARELDADRASLAVSGYVGEAIAARRLAHIVENAWRSMDGRLGFDGIPLFARESDSVHRVVNRALLDIEHAERVRIPTAPRTVSLFENARFRDRGLVDPNVSDRLVSIVEALDPSAKLERAVHPLSEPILAQYRIPLVIEPWSRIIERSLEQPVPLVDVKGEVIGIGALDGEILPISSLAGSPSVFSLFVESKGSSDVSASVIGLGMCTLRHIVHPDSGSDTKMRDASIAIHRALAMPPLDPSVSYRFAAGSYAEVPFVASRTVRIGYRPDFSGLIEREGSYDLLIADAKVSPFSSRPMHGRRDQLLVYGSLLGCDLRAAGVPIGSVHALIYSLPEEGVSDVFEPSARMVFDPDDPVALGLVSYLERLPALKKAHEDPAIRDHTKRSSHAAGLCDVCREAFKDRYEACARLLANDS